MSVVVILLNWRNASDTIAAVESLLQTNSEHQFKILVCDNASGDGSEDFFLNWANNHPSVSSDFLIKTTDDSARIATAFKKQVIWISTGSNLGFAGGNNVGVRLAQRYGDFQYFWFLNNDCLVEPTTMDALIARMEQDPTIGICGARLRYVEPADRLQAFGGAIHNRWTGRAQYIGHWATPEQVHSREEVEQTLSYVCGASMFVRQNCLKP